MYVVYLDRYNLEDPLFLQALARGLGKAGRGGPPVLLVHGAGELAERRLEGEGYDVCRTGRVLEVGSAAERRIVERAVRELNQKIVGMLNDNLAHGVGFQGTDRGLLRTVAGGGLTTGKTGWLAELAQKKVVPVISAVAGTGPEVVEVVEVDAALSAAELAHALGSEVLFVGRGKRPDALGNRITASDLPQTVHAEPDAMRLVLERGVGAVLGWMPDPFSEPVNVAL